MNSGFLFNASPLMFNSPLLSNAAVIHPPIPPYSILHLIPSRLFQPSGISPTQQLLFFHTYSFTNSEFYHPLDAAEPLDQQADMQSRGVKRQPEFHLQSSPDQKRARAHESPPPHASGSKVTSKRQQELVGRITRYIWDRCERNGQLQSLYVKKMKLRDAIYAVMKGVFPYCGLYIVGSSMNGFGDMESDMDLCLMLSHSQIDQKKDATEILRLLHTALRHCKFLSQVRIIRAKVPILRFVDRISNVECDININNQVGIRNTHLLSAYSQMDARIVPLVKTVKRWARAQNINDASQGSVSSYSLVLMVLHYLQYGCSPPVIPSLQQKYPHKFNSDQDIRRITLNDELPTYTSPNEQSIGELFLGFLEYYAVIFDFESDCISVRLGTKIPRHVAMKQCTENSPNQWKCLCIEEPFNLSNTARSVFDITVFQRILHVFRKTHLHIRSSGNMQAIFDKPF
ncbi:hypothetical protein CAPTEDRAFT_208596 [Capitella teleta]|uniref:Uncharacterized protein n=1 Tax=Capitella teleta TaxID=283909 RepID=R7URE9_CAPTE|nr:hypothetical protein CAPTEDRAFT_208596 [Capitella teleta]|eukprot:ELU05986.1 hypothetical protein CAPTEDRAFT_208596 [Capitella teleta]